MTTLVYPLGHTKEDRRVVLVNGARLWVGGLRMPCVCLTLLGVPKELLWGLISNSEKDLHFSYEFTRTF